MNKTKAVGFCKWLDHEEAGRVRHQRLIDDLIFQGRLDDGVITAQFMRMVRMWTQEAFEAGVDYADTTDVAKKP